MANKCECGTHIREIMLMILRVIRLTSIWEYYMLKIVFYNVKQYPISNVNVKH